MVPLNISRWVRLPNTTITTPEATLGTSILLRKALKVGVFMRTELMSPRPLMMHTQRESCGDKISWKRRTPQDKFSLPLLFLNISAIDVVWKHSSNFPEQRLLESKKLILTEHFHVSQERCQGWVAGGKKAWDAFPIILIFKKQLGDPCF